MGSLERGTLDFNEMKTLVNSKTTCTQRESIKNEENQQVKRLFLQSKYLLGDYGISIYKGEITSYSFKFS